MSAGTLGELGLEWMLTSFCATKAIDEVGLSSVAIPLQSRGISHLISPKEGLPERKQLFTAAALFCERFWQITWRMCR